MTVRGVQPDTHGAWRAAEAQGIICTYTYIYIYIYFLYIVSIIIIYYILYRGAWRAIEAGSHSSTRGRVKGGRAKGGERRGESEGQGTSEDDMLCYILVLLLPLRVYSVHPVRIATLDHNTI